MMMQGSFCSFQSRCPTKEEMETCCQIILSDESRWDPAQDIFNIYALSGERYKDFIDDTFQKFECAMSSCGVSPKEMATRAISSAKLHQCHHLVSLDHYGTQALGN